MKFGKENMMEDKILLGVQKDVFDERDYRFVGLDQPLPSKVDLRTWAREIEDQSSTNSCTGNAIVSLLELIASRSGKEDNLSRMFAYYNGRALLGEKWLAEDSGCTLREVIKGVYNDGICPEEAWPFNIAQVNTKPSAEAYQIATQRKITQYQRIEEVGNGYLGWETQCKCIKKALAQGFPVYIGMRLGEKFFNISGPLNTHSYPPINTTNRYIGNHAMVIVGYDDDLGKFILENSWGTNWGDNGFGAINYGIIGSDVFDGWVITGYDGLGFEFKPYLVPRSPITMYTVDPHYEDEFSTLIINSAPNVRLSISGTDYGVAHPTTNEFGDCRIDVPNGKEGPKYFVVTYEENVSVQAKVGFTVTKKPVEVIPPTPEPIPVDPVQPEPTPPTPDPIVPPTPNQESKKSSSNSIGYIIAAVVIAALIYQYLLK